MSKNSIRMQEQEVLHMDMVVDLGLNFNDRFSFYSVDVKGITEKISTFNITWFVRF